MQGKIELVDGLVTMQEAECLFNLASQMPEGGVGIEIGSWKGKSSVSLGFGCVGKRKKIFCVDPWCYEPAFISWIETVRILGLGDYLTPVKEWAGIVFSNWDKKVDLVFIDGNHEVIDTMKDFMLIYPFVKIGGMIAFHDVGHADYPGVLQTWLLAKIFMDSHLSSGSIYWGVKKLVR